MKKIILIISIIILFVIISSAISMTDNLMIRVFIIIVGVISFSIFLSMIVLPIIVAKTFAKKDIKKEKLSKEDIVKNELMYREILHNYSPAVLSYIDNMEFNYEKTVISVLLNLKLKGIIEEKENSIIKKVYNTSNMELDEIEKIVLENIQDGKVKVEKEKLQSVVINEALKKKVLSANYNNRDILLGKVKKLVATFLILFIIFLILNILEISISFLLLGILAIYPIASIIYIFIYKYKYQENPIFRTQEGTEINKKLEGLKNFIREYSLLDSKDSEQLQIWEEYLIYSVIFDQNEIIAKQYCKYL